MSESKGKEPTHTDTPSSTDSEAEDELPPLPASRPGSVYSVRTDLRPSSPKDTRGKVTKVDKHHKSSTSSATSKFKKLFEDKPALVPDKPTPPRTHEPTMSNDRGISPKNPDTYAGGSKDLERFLSQCQLYFLLKGDDFKRPLEKVLFAGSHLRGPAADWFTPYIRDIARGNNARQETKELFGSFLNFEKGLEQLYGSRDKQRVVVRQLQQLKQQGPASQYTATFRRLALDSGWNDAALATQYYSGLRDSIKDELARGDRPDDLDALIERSISIDERFFERRMERGRYSGYTPNQKQPRQPYYGPEPMDLSATRGPLTPKDRDHRMKNNLCLYCGKPGHRARECKAKQTKAALAATRTFDPYDDDIKGPPQYLKATRMTHDWVNNLSTHDTLSWTACYDDYCHTHRSDKMGAGWFPKAPRRRNTPAPPPMVRRNAVQTPTRNQDNPFHPSYIPNTVQLSARPGAQFATNPRVLELEDDEDESDSVSTESVDIDEDNPQRAHIPNGKIQWWKYDGTYISIVIKPEQPVDFGNLRNFPHDPTTTKAPESSKDHAAQKESTEQRRLISLSDSDEDGNESLQHSEAPTCTPSSSLMDDE